MSVRNKDSSFEESVECGEKIVLAPVCFFWFFFTLATCCAFCSFKEPLGTKMASLARLTIIKKNGGLGGVCPMDTKELIIGRRAPLQPSHPAPLP